jgi:hypothetical protein
MMQLFSLEFLVAVLFIIDLFLIFLLILFVKRVNGIQMEPAGDETGEFQAALEAERSAAKATESARDVMDMLGPLIETSKDAALEFDQLIREKKKITKDLNDALDSKIISINLMLSRASALQKKLEQQQMVQPQPTGIAAAPMPPTQEQQVLDQQNQIIDLYYKQVDVDTIAEQLSIPKGEVQLVIDLKEKFVAMEQAQ